MNQQAAQFEIRTPDECGEAWDQYVKQHRKASIFHTRPMQEVFAATPNYEPFAIAALIDGQITALLTAVRITTVRGLASSFTSRSIWYAEPLSESGDDGQLALAAIVREHDQRMKGCTLFAEVRPLMQHGEEREVLESLDYEYQDYLNFVVDTTSDIATLWGNLSKSSRKKIKRTTNRGVTIEIENTHAGIDELYKLVRKSYRRSKVPVADRMLFHEALDLLPVGTVQVRIARFEGAPVSAGIGLVHGNRFYAWYGGGDRSPGITPFDNLTWDEIRWSSEANLEHYDFGGAGWPDEDYGPRDFKAKFGGELVTFGRYRRVYGKLAMKVAKSSYEIVRQLLPI